MRVDDDRCAVPIGLLVEAIEFVAVIQSSV